MSCRVAADPWITRLLDGYSSGYASNQCRALQQFEHRDSPHERGAVCPAPAGGVARGAIPLVP